MKPRIVWRYYPKSKRGYWGVAYVGIPWNQLAYKTKQARMYAYKLVEEMNRGLVP